MQPIGSTWQRASVGVMAIALVFGLSVAASANAAQVRPRGGCAPGSVLAACTLSVAWGPGTEANAIFPFDNSAHYTQVDVNEFQNLMFRPLYWFGSGASTAVQYPLSLANAPLFLPCGANTCLEINMKNWIFEENNLPTSPTEPVNCRSVLFWLNMDKAVGHAQYGRFVSTYGITDQLLHATCRTSLVVYLEFAGSLNHAWLLDSELSQIVPLPLAWDKVANGGVPGSGNCSDAIYPNVGPCKNVWVYLNNQNKLYATYATNPLWQWVDGPYRLSAFGVTAGLPNGNDILIPNASYSGPVRSIAGRIVYRPFAALAAEVTALQLNQLDIGYSAPNLVSPAPSPCTAGVNLVPLLNNYRANSGCVWAFNAAYYNFQAGGLAGAEIRQPYIREALQRGVNQVAIIAASDKGYACPTYSPWPGCFAGGPPNPYPFSVAAGRLLLIGGGWDVNVFPAVCTRPTGCGVGIPSGSKLAITYTFLASDPFMASQVNAEKANWTAEGFNVTLNPQLTTAALATFCFSGGPVWQICQGTGYYEEDGYFYSPNSWHYANDYYPSGELLYLAHNPGSYNDPVMLGDVRAATTAGALLADVTYAGKQLPFMYQPTTLTVGELKTCVTGSLPTNPLGDFMPEYDNTLAC